MSTLASPKYVLSQRSAKMERAGAPHDALIVSALPTGSRATCGRWLDGPGGISAGASPPGPLSGRHTLRRVDSTNSTDRYGQDEPDYRLVTIDLAELDVQP